MDRQSLGFGHQHHSKDNLLIDPIYKINFTIDFGQSNESEFLRSLCPFGLITYFPVIAFTIPCPPEVPGKKAESTADDSLNTLSTSIGLPASKTVSNGMFLSSSLIFLMTSLSNLSKSSPKVVLWTGGM
jgi:hypothetical protein